MPLTSVMPCVFGVDDDGLMDFDSAVNWGATGAGIGSTDVVCYDPDPLFYKEATSDISAGKKFI